MRLLLSLALSAFASGACKLVPAPSLTDLGKLFARAEYQPDADGWAAARRRRVLTQYFVGHGLSVATQAEPLRQINPPDKYRRTHLLVHVGGSRASEGHFPMVTYALTAASVAAATEPQRLCDARLLAALNEMTASEQQTITLRLSMDSECRKGSTIVD